MIDVYSHILTGLDNGARSFEESVTMARKASDEGIDKIIATPSVTIDTADDRQMVFDAVSRLNDKLNEGNVPVKIYPGQLVHAYGDLCADLENGKIIPLNRTSQYILLELPNSHVPQYIGKLIFDIQISGYIPVIVHPELNLEFVDNPNKVYHMVKNGALTLVNAGSLVGESGRKTQKLALDLIGHNLTHFIGTGARRHSRAGFHMKDAYQVVRDRLGETVMYHLKENGDSIIDGLTVHKEEPVRFETKKFWKLFSVK